MRSQKHCVPILFYRLEKQKKQASKIWIERAINLGRDYIDKALLYKKHKRYKAKVYQSKQAHVNKKYGLNES